MVADAFDASAMRESTRWLRSVAAHWTARGHHVRVIVRAHAESESAAEAEDDAGVHVWRPPSSRLEETLGAALDPEPDVLLMASMGPFGPRIVEILRDLPVLLDAHDFHSICPNDDLLRRPQSMPCGEHYPHPHCGSCAGLTRLRAMEERMALTAAARVIVTHSSYARTRLSAALGRRVELVEYGVDADRFGEGAAAPESEEIAAMLATPTVPRALFLGPPTLPRGAGSVMDMLVALQARVHDAEIVVAGSDADAPEWQDAFVAEARELGVLEHVRVLPGLLPADLPALHKACSVAMAPLVALEAGGLSIIEAMASGLPVVASPLGAVQDIIEDGEDGLLVTATDIPEFADALQRLMLDPAAREELGSSARARVVERYGLDRSLRRLETLCADVRNRRRKAA